MSNLSGFAGVIWLLFLTKITVELSYDTRMVGVYLPAREGLSIALTLAFIPRLRNAGTRFLFEVPRTLNLVFLL